MLLLHRLLLFVCYKGELTPYSPSCTYLTQALREYDKRTRLDKIRRGHEYAEDLLKRVLSSTDCSLGTAAQPPLRGATHQDEDDTGTAVSSPPSPPLVPCPEDAPGPSAIEPEAQEEPPQPGEVVAVVHADSTVTAPHITFGRVIRSDDCDHVILSSFHKVARNTYAFKVGAKERAKVTHCVSPVDMVYMPTNNTYSLRTTTTAIHLSKFPAL